ncbi:MAG: hypothetical protein IK003_09780 [Prevotella sp.]|nr:hypothetical protein [Prevotella sp.]
MNIKDSIRKITLVNDLLEKWRYEKKLDRRKLSFEEKTKRLMDTYERKVGYRMDINNPRTFTEKIQWYKLFYQGNINLERLVDKYLFKQYIKEKLGEGYTIPLIGAWESVDELRRDWDKLPEVFCLKSTVQSDGKFIKFIHNKSSLDIEKLAKEIRKWLLPKNTLLSSYCRAYYNAVPRVIAEEYMENVCNQLYDYKFFCFDGVPFAVYAAMEHFESEDYPIAFYDMDWKKLEVKYGHHRNDDVPKPKHLDEMIELSKKLSEGFPFIRVDFFDTEEKLYVAELTMYPGGGYIKYEPESFNEKMGEMFKLPVNS